MRIDLLFAGLVGLVVIAGPAAPLQGQDVELLGEVYGTRPPEGYFQQMREDPASFRFSREGLVRMHDLRESMAGGAALPTLVDPSIARALGPRGEPMVGTFRFPLVLGTFSDGPGALPYSRDAIQREFFDGPNSYYQTIPELYAEMSAGRVQLQGVTFDWVDTGLTRDEVTRGSGALVSHPTEGIGGFIEAIVQSLDDAGVDWSEFDLTGDGFVDVLTVMQPLHGAECTGDYSRVWSHRWNLRSATQGRLDPGFATSTPRPNGPGVIYINDYTVQPVVACNEQAINEIGVFAHELGHAFGLPDLYPTGGQAHRGAGNWDLMGTGSWGCQGASPSRPCHMGAWSKAVLGWVDVQEIPYGVDAILDLPPVLQANRVLKIRAQDGSREHLLLENRQRIGSDLFLPEPGLLIWQIDEEMVDAYWPLNALNNDASRMGVRLRQADGMNHLAQPGGGRGDRGDPFPGCIKASLQEYLDPTVPCGENREFHAGSIPASHSHFAGPMGVTLTEIELVGSVPHDVRFRVSTGYTAVTLRAEEAGAPMATPSFRVDGADAEVGPVTFLSAPFQLHEVAAAPGLSLGEGVRVPFREWSDGGPRVRSFTTPRADTTLVASYEGREFHLSISTNDPAPGIEPGTLIVDPVGLDHWYADGTTLTIEANPRVGFAFREWSGGFSGPTNPAAFTIEGPTGLHAEFDLIYGLVAHATTVPVEAAAPREIAFEVTEGNDPVRWSVEAGTLPDGLEFRAEEGTIVGAAMETGTFPLEILARDGIGLEARASVVLEVGPPGLGIQELVGPFLQNGEGPSPLQREFLDRNGNRNGSYDVGDFRAFLLAHPTPGTAAQQDLLRSVVPLGSFEGGEAP